MNITQEQLNVLLSLTTEWQTPMQIASKLPQTVELSDIQQVLKTFLSEGLVQTNPVVLGLYRLTKVGEEIKESELG